MTSTARPKCFRSGEVKIYQLGRLTVTFKTTGLDSGGAYTFAPQSSRLDPAQGFSGILLTMKPTSSAKVTSTVS
jgi:hypothetical protein